MKISREKLNLLIQESLSNPKNAVYSNIESLKSPVRRDIFNEDYVTKILGISIPLNESYPYTSTLQKQIIEEHIIFEGFFNDFKKLGGDTKNAALALRYIMGDSSRLETYASIVKKDMQEAYKNLVKFLETVIEDVKSLPEKISSKVTKILKWATSLVGKIKTLAKAAMSSVGWKGAMLISGALVGIGYIWSQLKDAAPGIIDGLQKVKDFVSKNIKESARILSSSSLLEAANAIDLIIEQEDSVIRKAIDKLKETIKPLLAKAKEMGVEALKGLALKSLEGALTGGIATAFSALKKVFGGSKMVFSFLGEPLKKFIGKIEDPKEEKEEANSGKDDPTEKNESFKRKSLQISEYQIRKIIREELQLEFFGMFDGGSDDFPTWSNGKVNQRKLDQDQKKVYNKGYELGYSNGTLPTSPTELFKKAYEEGRVDMSTSLM